MAANIQKLESIYQTSEWLGVQIDTKLRWGTVISRRFQEKKRLYSIKAGSGEKKGESPRIPEAGPLLPKGWEEFLIHGAAKIIMRIPCKHQLQKKREPRRETNILAKTKWQTGNFPQFGHIHREQHDSKPFEEYCWLCHDSFQLTSWLTAIYRSTCTSGNDDSFFFNPTTLSKKLLQGPCSTLTIFHDSSLTRLIRRDNQPLVFCLHLQSIRMVLFLKDSGTRIATHPHSSIQLISRLLAPNNNRPGFTACPPW